MTKARQDQRRLMIVGDAGDPHIQKWAGCFRDRGWKVMVVSRRRHEIEGVIVEQFPPPDRWWSGLPRVRFGGGWQLWLAAWRRWRGLLASFRPDIVHVHYVDPDARNHFYYRGLRRFVVSVYGADVVFEPDQTPSKATERRIRTVLEQADALTATTEFLARAMKPYAPEEKTIHVIPFGVDCDIFFPREQEASTSENLVLGFVKSLEPKYGPDVLVEGFARIASSRPETRLLMAGSGSLDRELHRRVEELGLGGRVEFLGRVPHAEVPGLLRRMDIFVMPSVHWSETFGVAAIEAGASGLPVVACRVGGVPEAVVDRKTGILVEPRDPGALARACLHLMDQPSLRASMGRAARRYVLSNYRLEDNAAMMSSVYESLLQST